MLAVFKKGHEGHVQLEREDSAGCGSSGLENPSELQEKKNKKMEKYGLKKLRKEDA